MIIEPESLRLRLRLLLNRSIFNALLVFFELFDHLLIMREMRGLDLDTFVRLLLNWHGRSLAQFPLHSFQLLPQLFKSLGIGLRVWWQL